MKKKSWFRDFVECLLISGVIVFVVIEFLIFPCVVDGDSMYPTLKNNQKGYSFVCTRLIGVNRFDIVVIKVDDTNKKIVKRIIGMPNETIEYKDNKLYIDGEYVSEDFLDGTYTQDFKVVLGEDEYYCLGDNRQASKDSRYYGAFSSSDFISTHMLIISPYEEFGYRS